MKKRLTGLFLAVALLVSVFAGCSGAKTQKADNGMATTVEATAAGAYAGDMEAQADGTRAGVTNETAGNSEQPKSESSTVDSIGGGGNASQNVTNAILAERKVIRSANVTVEVENFDEAYAQIDTMILGIGFIQSTNINSEKYYMDNDYKLLRRGTIIIRVDREKFDKVLNSLKGIGEVLNWNINGEDVTDKYFDTESRLRLYRIEEAKLEEYLKKLSDLDQIFKTESRLTEIRYQIEALTGNLKKMSDLVDLSTIAITMNEKHPESGKPVAPPTYVQKLLNNFLESLKGVTGFMGDLIIIIVAAIPILILIGLFVLIAVLIYRKIPKKRLPGSKELSKPENKDNNVGQ